MSATPSTTKHPERRSIRPARPTLDQLETFERTGQWMGHHQAELQIRAATKFRLRNEKRLLDSLKRGHLRIQSLVKTHLISDDTPAHDEPDTELIADVIEEEMRQHPHLKAAAKAAPSALAIYVIAVLAIIAAALIAHLASSGSSTIAVSGAL